MPHASSIFLKRASRDEVFVQAAARGVAPFILGANDIPEFVPVRTIKRFTRRFMTAGPPGRNDRRSLAH